MLKNIQRKIKGVIAYDFDGVIATYNRPFRYNVLGKPNYDVIRSIRYFYKQGYYILIFTGRLKTRKMQVWLKKYKVPYNGFNKNPLPIPLVDNFKPYYNVIIEDKAVYYHYLNKKKSTKQLIKEIKKRLKESNE